MITLDQIISGNLEMIKSQEAELLKSLSFVQKLKKLFQSQSGEHRGRPKGSTNVRKKRAARVKKATVKEKAASLKPKAASVKTKPVSLKPKAVRVLKPGSHLANIVSALKEKNVPLTSRELIDTLFSQQTKDTDFKHYRSLISPALSDASKRGIVIRKEGKILLPA